MCIGNFERCLAITLKWEGGYSNNPDDPGGATNLGITQREYDRWRDGKQLHRQSVRLITMDEARAIYRLNYWDAMQCDSLPLGYDLCVFDAAVNSGTGRARTWRAAYPTIHAIQLGRLSFLQRLGHLWRVFGRGWSMRVHGIETQALAMLQPAAANTHVQPLKAAS